MRHAISFYIDHYKKVEFCLNCGKEESELISECQGGNPLPLTCIDCGQEFHPTETCKNCQQIRKMFQDTIDKKNSRN